eukprot:TRINITY_DN5663_c0_g2_i1.p2 TRINITY_DN5663_c0_g2~~TRINITY_DN5663_c0_g2_i1.p2  ORF type:complete len:197 (+),score=51.20 TRINITY_DN5663_c0_g2_i1:300-890(+)
MKSSMDYKESDKLDLVHGLCKLFAEIDINDDKTMEWREFTQYIIDAVMQDNIKADNKGELPNQKEMLELAHSRKFLRFCQSNCADNVVHESALQKVAFYPSLNKLMIIENQSHLIKFASPDLHLKESIDLFNKQHNLLAEDTIMNKSERRVKYFVLSAAYSENDKMVLYRIYSSLHVSAAIKHFKYSSRLGTPSSE